MLLKMKYLLPGLLFLLLLGCKKEQTPPPQTGTDEYVEFKIDNTLTRMDGSKEQVVSAVVFNDSPNFLYQLVISVNATPNVRSFTLQVGSGQPLEAKNYVRSLANPGTEIRQVVFVTSQLNTYAPAFDTPGNIQLTRLERQAGGYIEGTFAFAKMDHRDKNANLLSSNHVFTDGKFRVKIK